MIESVVALPSSQVVTPASYRRQAPAGSRLALEHARRASETVGGGLGPGPLAARPRCSRFTIAPVPERANSSRPQASEPAMPSALRMRPASKPISLPQATAAPNGPVVPGA